MELDLQPYSLQRPHKVEWFVPILPENPLDIITSKTTRKFLRNNLEDFLKDSGLRIETHPVSQEEFVAWLKYYQEKMEENHFDVMANEAWYQTKIEQGCKVHGIFVYDDNKMVGSGIVGETPEKKFTIHFKASDKLESVKYRNASLGTIIEYYFLKLAYEEKAVTISSGRSRNAFGVVNKLGYLNFKLRYGYQAVAVQEEPQYTTVEVLEGEPVCFYAYKNNQPDQLKLYVYNHGQEISESLKEILTYIEFETIS